MTTVLLITVLLVLAVLGAIVLIHVSMYHGAWSTCRRCGLRVSLWDVALMAFRRVDYDSVCECAAALHQATTPATMRELEGVCLCGGNVRRVTMAKLVANQEQVNADFRSLTAIELLGYDPVDWVKRTRGRELPPLAQPPRPAAHGPR